MSKLIWKPGNMIYPLPAVMISCGDFEKKENLNIITVAWTGTINTNPPMTYISIKPSRHSYNIIKSSKEFVINLTTEELVYQTDFSGVRSGRDFEKDKFLNLEYEKSKFVNAPSIKKSPVNIECRVFEIKELGSHHMFLANVLGIRVDEKYMDDNNRLRLDKAKLIAYSHGQYYSLGRPLGRFGFSVAKNKKKN